MFLQTSRALAGTAGTSAAAATTACRLCRRSAKTYCLGLKRVLTIAHSMVALGYQRGSMRISSHEDHEQEWLHWLPMTIPDPVYILCSLRCPCPGGTSSTGGTGGASRSSGSGRRFVRVLGRDWIIKHTWRSFGHFGALFGVVWFGPYASLHIGSSGHAKRLFIIPRGAEDDFLKRLEAAAGGGTSAPASAPGPTVPPTGSVLMSTAGAGP